jgi:hypothetical protein
LDSTSGTLVGTSSIYFPYSSGPSGVETLFDGTLAAGNYSIDTNAAIVDNDSGDPNYQVDFTPGAATPEPSSLLLLGTGLLGLAFVAFRKAKASGVVLSM